MEKALAIYGSASGGGVREGDMPVQDKSKLVESLREAIKGAEAFCREHGVDLSKIQAASGFDRIKLLEGS